MVIAFGNTIFPAFPPAFPGDPPLPAPGPVIGPLMEKAVSVLKNQSAGRWERCGKEPVSIRSRFSVHDFKSSFIRKFLRDCSIRDAGSLRREGFSPPRGVYGT